MVTISRPLAFLASSFAASHPKSFLTSSLSTTLSASTFSLCRNIPTIRPLVVVAAALSSGLHPAFTAGATTTTSPTDSNTALYSTCDDSAETKEPTPDDITPAGPKDGDTVPFRPVTSFDMTGVLNAEDAAALDEELMMTPGFTLEQLMELAGLAVAEAIYQTAPSPDSRILIVCGPGNNGGDGLVAARHLRLFKFQSIIVVYPKNTSAKQPHYANLVQQCQDFGIPILETMPEDLSNYGMIVDAIFGFSFAGTPREPFGTILNQIMATQKDHSTPVLSVDVPSGWSVNEGDVNGIGFEPDILVSLTAPKVCSIIFRGRHFVGGRFLPPAFAAKYGIQMPPYPGTAQVMELPLTDAIEAEAAAAAMASGEGTNGQDKKEDQQPFIKILDSE